ncbi:Ger(x)C family spore germination protein [uncultured Clostridium sp.]|uniref:Ger(x)C family spore germination protein n=1 Tax=uncultured Clostridium sp. TaxID=59620 RepID=UPI0026052E21|nr:Ger(x)C family spore germination protein [uncultured Clostridium sp.]
MSIRKLIKLIVLILVILLMLAGCYNYNDINNATFVTSVVFDLDPLDNVIVYMDCVKPYRNNNESSDNGKRIIYKGQGKTILEAIRDVNMASTYKINFTQNRAIIFTEAAAKKGVNKFLSILNNDQEFLFKPYMFVYFGDVNKLLTIVASDEEYLGIFLNEVVQKNKANPRAIITGVNDYMVNSGMGSNYALLGAIEIRKDVVDERVELSGGVIMKDNIMQERISILDGFSYNMMWDNIKTGTVEAPNPQMEKGFITLEILNNKTDTSVEYDGNRVLLKKTVNLKTTLAEAQGRFIVDKESMANFVANEERRIEEYLNQFFDKFNRKNIDILGVERLLEMKYPSLIKSNVLSILDLEVKVNLNIEGTSVIRESYFS